MLFYDWPKIYEAAGGNPNECVKIVRMMVESTIPKNYYDPMYHYSLLNFVGNSFLLHPDVLLYYSHRHEIRDVAIYISMASMRPFAEYTVNGTLTFPMSALSINPMQYLVDPKSELLWVDNNDDLHFLYEETPKQLN